MSTWKGKLYVALAFVVLSVGCATERPPSQGSSPPSSGWVAKSAADAGSTALPAETGPEVVVHLQRRFDEHVADCGSAVRPAFLCSGILLRSTDYSASYDSWSPNPATAAYGVSFSWLRQDANFNETYPSYNGFIVYPLFFSDDGNYDTLTIRCAYPADAWTGAPDRCRETCQNKGITTATQWLASGYLVTSGPNQCAFGVDQGTPATAAAFMQIVELRDRRAYFGHDEIIVSAWSQTAGVRMPIEAFFYRGPSGLPIAKLDQQNFRTKTGRWVPVIHWTPATSVTGRATFSYSVTDQAITE